MPRAKGGVVTRRRHKKILKLAKGYWGRKSKLFRPANQQVMKSLMYAYRTAGPASGSFESCGLPGSTPQPGKTACRTAVSSQVCARRASRSIGRSLADLAVRDQEAFHQLVTIAKENQ